MGGIPVKSFRLGDEEQRGALTVDRQYREWPERRALRACWQGSSPMHLWPRSLFAALGALLCDTKIGVRKMGLSLHIFLSSMFLSKLELRRPKPRPRCRLESPPELSGIELEPGLRGRFPSRDHCWDQARSGTRNNISVRFLLWDWLKLNFRL